MLAAIVILVMFSMPIAVLGLSAYCNSYWATVAMICNKEVTGMGEVHRYQVPRKLLGSVTQVEPRGFS